MYLTIREITVLKHILLGYTAKQIAEKIKISPKTVESYVDAIRLKLQAKNTHQHLTALVPMRNLLIEEAVLSA